MYFIINLVCVIIFPLCSWFYRFLLFAGPMIRPIFIISRGYSNVPTATPAKIPKNPWFLLFLSWISTCTELVDAIYFLFNILIIFFLILVWKIYIEFLKILFKL